MNLSKVFNYASVNGYDVVGMLEYFVPGKTATVLNGDMNSIQRHTDMAINEGASRLTFRMKNDTNNISVDFTGKELQ